MDVDSRGIREQRFRCTRRFKHDFHGPGETFDGDLQAVLVGGFDPTDCEGAVGYSHHCDDLDRHRSRADLRESVGGQGVAIELLGAVVGQMGVSVMPIRPDDDRVAR